MINYGIVATVTGDIKTYSFPDKQTGEIKAGLSINYPGGKVGVSLDPDIVEQFNDGEIWEFQGDVVSNANGIRMTEVKAAKKLQAAPQKTQKADVFDFGGANSKK